MNKIRIWEYEEIAENLSPSYEKVPDSAMRPGESNSEWRLRMLLRDLQALAADPEILIRAYDRDIPVADDLANDLQDRVELALRCVEDGLITQDMWERARDVDAMLEEMSRRHDSSLWTDEALRNRAEWSKVRRLARGALEAMGYDLEPPPPRSM